MLNRSQARDCRVRAIEGEWWIIELNGTPPRVPVTPSVSEVMQFMKNPLRSFAALAVCVWYPLVRRRYAAAPRRQGGNLPRSRSETRHAGDGLDCVFRYRTRTGADRNHRRYEECLGSQAGHHHRQDGRQGDSHQRRGRHERKPGVYRRQTGGRGGSAAERVFAGCDLRHHADRTDAGDQGLRQVDPAEREGAGNGAVAGVGGCARRHAGAGSGRRRFAAVLRPAIQPWCRSRRR